MSDDVSAVSMTDGALVIAARAADLARLKGQPLSVHHWFLALLERHAPMLEDIASLDSRAALARAERAIAGGELGVGMPRETLEQRAAEQASQRGAASASERTLRGRSSPPSTGTRRAPQAASSCFATGSG